MKAYVSGRYVDVDDMEAMELPKSEQMVSLKAELAAYDYIGTKIAMGVATKEEYADEIAYTESLREKIRILEGEIIR